MNNNSTLNINYEYYLANHDQLCEKYLNKFIIIKDKNVCGSYDTFEEAIEEAQKMYKLGTFIIQECTKDVDTPTQVFHSRVIAN